MERENKRKKDIPRRGVGGIDNQFKRSLNYSSFNPQIQTESHHAQDCPSNLRGIAWLKSKPYRTVSRVLSDSPQLQQFKRSPITPRSKRRSNDLRSSSKPGSPLPPPATFIRPRLSRLQPTRSNGSPVLVEVCNYWACLRGFYCWIWLSCYSFQAYYSL